MGLIIKKKLNGMSWWAKTSLVLLLTMTASVFMYQGWFKPLPAQAAVTTPVPIASVVATTTAATVNLTIPTSVINKRMLVVGVTYGASAAVTGAVTCTYGGTALTAVPNTDTSSTAAYEHTHLFYMPENATLMNGTARALTFVKPAGSTLISNAMWYAVYDGVDQSAPTGGSFNSADVNLSSTTATALTTPLAINTGGIGFGVSTILRVANTTAYTLTPPANWTTQAAQAAVTTTNATNRYCFSSVTPNATDTVTYTASNVAGRVSSSAMVIKMYVPQPASTIIDCGGCHGYPSGTHSFVDNTVAVGRANGQFPGSHNVHVNTNGMICADCHGTVPTTGQNDHADGNVTMAAIRGGTYSKGTVPVANTFTAGTCNGTSCHGTTSALSWGTDYSSYDTCTKCHGTLTTGTATEAQKAPTVPAAAAHGLHLSTTTIAPVVACVECHVTVASANQAGHMNGTKDIYFGGTVGTANSTSPTHSTAGCNTTWCHGGTNYTLIPQNKPTARANPTWGTTFGTTSVFGTATGTASTNTGSGRCAQCHGYPPASAAHNGVTQAATNSCKSCHSHVNTAGTGFETTGLATFALHINGIVEAGGSCTGCHKGTGSGVKNGRVAVVDQFDTAGNSHHVQIGTTVTDTACYACHWEAKVDGSIDTTYHTQTAGQPVNLVVWSGASRPTGTYTLGTNAVEYTSGGTAASTRANLATINNHCLGCHSAAAASANPFADGKNPQSYAWDATSVGARYSNTGTTTWGKFTGNATTPKTATKAFSAHGQATKNQRGWSTLVDTYPTATATSNILCFDCHNSHGSSTAAAGITSSYSSATGRRKGGILKDVVANKGGYTLTYKASAGGSTAQKNAYNAGAGLCFDCHNTATATTTIPWGYTGTFGFTPPPAQGTRGVVGLFDTPYFGQAGQNFISTLTFAYKAGMSVNQGGHFGASTSKGAFSGTITKRSFDPATPNGTVIQGLCTPCHDPHGVSTSVATAQAYSVPLLKGTWVTSPYKQESAPTTATRGGGSRVTGYLVGAGVTSYRLDQNTFVAAGTGTTGWVLSTNATTLQTTNDTQFAGLCTGCHLKANLNDSAAASSANWKTKGRIHNSVKGWASTAGGNSGNKVHAYTCSKCHTPHNSRLPRLLVTNCLDVKHKGRTASGADMNAAFSTGNGSGSGTGRFPGGGATLSSSKGSSQTSPWFFGTSGTTAGYPTCHDSATAGGATFSTTAEQWNTKSMW